jgi:hypothetical protein
MGTRRVASRSRSRPQSREEPGQSSALPLLTAQADARDLPDAEGAGRHQPAAEGDVEQEPHWLMVRLRLGGPVLTWAARTGHRAMGEKGVCVP